MVRNLAAKTCPLPYDEGISDDWTDGGYDEDRWENDGGKIHGTIHGSYRD